MERRTIIYFYICLIMLFSPVLSLQAAEQYRVTAKSLNVRQQPNASGRKVTSLPEGTIVTVTNTARNGWVGIEYPGGRGYVSQKYLEYIPQQEDMQLEPAGKDESSSGVVIERFLKSVSTSFSHRQRWPVYAILVLTIIMLVLLNKKNESEAAAWSFIVTFCLSCCLSIFYFWGYDGDVTWFCSPDEVGWILTVICFFVFGAVFFIHLISYLGAMYTSDALGDRECQWMYCVYGLGACLVTLVIGIFWSPMLIVSGVLFCLLQIGWPIYMIYCNYKDEGSWVNLIFTYFLYLLGFVATVFMMVHFIKLLIMAIVIAVGLFIVAGILSASGSGKKIYDEDGNHIGWLK